MDINHIQLVNITEQAAIQLAAQDADKVAAQGPKIYADYGDALYRAGWRSNCPRSPLPGLLKRDMPIEDAKAQGYQPTRKAGLGAYVLVATSFDPGYIGRASKVYYSVWGK